MDLYFRYPASEYDRGRIFENVSFWVDEVIRIAGLEENSTVLDLGCGTGSYAIELRRKTSAEVHGIDPSAEMIRVAESKDLSSTVSWQVGVAESLPFTPETFDCIFASQVWHHIEDKQKAADECYRVLKRGTPLIVRTISHEQWKEEVVFEFFPEILSSQLEAYPTMEEFREYFEKTGFSSVSTRPYQLERYIPPGHLIRAAQEKLWSMFKSLSKAGERKGIKKLKDYMSKHPNTPIRYDELITLVTAWK
jgi:2-polyprenyl-3-methyl-5-hydroxy-6-metoxy-1,4-benzoquinol methylase